MPKSRNGKNHKKKVAARNNRRKQERQRNEKIKKGFIDMLLKKEIEDGVFENTTPIPNKSETTLPTSGYII
jgi:hypothetical protein